ncbi:unnamed protein product [Rhizopus microsporus]|nr:Putative Prefoldin, alpha subunit [Rhizopus microsporus]
MHKLICKTTFLYYEKVFIDDRPDTTYIYVHTGFGFHVQFTLDEAKTFIKKKEQQLQKLADKHTQEADKIKAHIKMALEAISEILVTSS